MKSKLILITLTVGLAAFIFIGCSVPGLSGGKGTIKWEVDGTYTGTSSTDFVINYSIVRTDGTTESLNSDFEPGLPWSDTRELESGTGVSMNYTVLEPHSTNVTLRIYENGVVKAEHSINRSVDPDADLGGIPSPSLTHVVGQ
jgi:hypothetical protein